MDMLVVEDTRHAAPAARTDITGGWRKELQTIVDRHAGMRMNGNIASHRTRELTASVLFAVFGTLAGLGFKLQNPRNLGERHVEALVRHWHWQGRAVATMQNELSILRKFAGWIGKKNMVRGLTDYLPNVPKAQLNRTTIAAESKSWSENGINVDQKIAQADALNERFGLILRVGVAFGLRRKELIMLKPWKCDRGDYLAIYPNSGQKGGSRARMIPIENAYQRQVLDYVKARIPKGDSLGWKTTRRGKPATLAYNLQEYERRMHQIGITKGEVGVSGHGMRAEFAENAALTHPETPFVPPTLGGPSEQMPLEDLNQARAQISEMLGHSRTGATSSYYGHFQVRRAPRKISDEQREARSARSRPAPRAVEMPTTAEARRDKAQERIGRRRTDALLDVRQMDLPLKDRVVIFRPQPPKSDKDC